MRVVYTNEPIMHTPRVQRFHGGINFRLFGHVLFVGRGKQLSRGPAGIR